MKTRKINRELKFFIANRGPKLVRIILSKFLNTFSYVEIQTITACNRRCKYCPNSIYESGLLKNKKYMDEGLFKKIIDELSELNFNDEIHLHFYGEPLLDERLSRLVRYIKSKLKVDIVVFTNGDFLTLEKYKELSEAGIDEFVITRHNEKRGDFIKYKKEKKEFSDIAENGAVISYAKVKKVQNRGGDLDFKIRKKKFCPSALLVVIDYQGNIILCCNDYHSSIKFGNLKKEKLIDME